MKEGAYEGKVHILGPRRVIFISVRREKTDASQTSCSGSKADV